MATDNHTPAEIPITVRIATVHRDGYHVDLGEDADGRYTFAALRRAGHPACWCWGHPACLALARMMDDQPFIGHLDAAGPRLEAIMQVAFCATVVSDAQDASLRARHYPDPRREALRDALTAAWEAGAAAAMDAPAMRERRRAEVDRLIAGVPR